MKNLVPWLKAHWIIPVLTLVAIAALPTAWYFADQMRTSFATEYQNTIKKDYDSVADNAAKVNFHIPSLDGTGKVLETSQPVNEALIKRYGEIWADVSSKVGTVSATGLKFNQGDHKVLIDGLFPPPPDRFAAERLGREFIDVYIRFHKYILQQARAGGPARAEEIAQQLTDHRTAAESKILAELGRQPDAREQAKIAEELSGMRIAFIRRNAAQIGVYAEPSVFTDVPASIPDVAPSPSQAWDMQEKSWINQDICAAIALANGKTGGVSESVVKRLSKVSIRPPAWDVAQPVPAANAFDPGEDRVPLNFSASITGRVSGPGSKNRWYDVRPATIDVVISSARLPQFLNALAATNFMTITDLDITKVDVFNDLREGYDYGDEHVVKATIQIETVWLREWRKAAMPPSVQKALGMDDKVDGGAGAAVNTPPPPPKPRPSAAPGGRPPGGAGPGAGAGGGRGGRGGGGGDRDD